MLSVIITNRLSLHLLADDLQLSETRIPNPLKPCLKGVFTLMVLGTLNALPTAYAQSTNDKPINVVIPLASGGWYRAQVVKAADIKADQ
jgi:hypothetical protein